MFARPVETSEYGAPGVAASMDNEIPDQHDNPRDGMVVRPIAGPGNVIDGGVNRMLNLLLHEADQETQTICQGNVPIVG
jgi:hypothetical protein